MIEARELTKKFDDITALDSIDASIKEGEVFGLIGTNGAGKSTFLRCAAGIYKPTSGSISIDGDEIFENKDVKKKFFFISDEQYFFPNSNPLEMGNYYKNIYSGFDMERYRRLLSDFGLSEKRKINTFSKGMKKQVSVLLAVSSGTDYIFCDETFDGLDPVMRQAVKSLFASDMKKRRLTPVIASHNLRELEDMCDHVGLLHRGGILLSRDIVDLKLNIHKVQFVLKDEEDEDKLSPLNVIKKERRGKLMTYTVRGNQGEIKAVMDAADTIFYEMIPLSLEEIFISETEVAGYDIKKIIFGE